MAIVPQISESNRYEYSVYGEMLLDSYNQVKVCFFLSPSICLSVYLSLYLLIFNLNKLVGVGHGF